ncbi:MAG: electron transfer flavoprotein subunit alpha/FixB family protein, partial [bacterium]|nr:electron transfer flavoprotein subunit alpha/FixB family protein [bacterium]
MGTIWVFAEASGGKVATISLELLAKAREVADTVEAVVGADGEPLAAELGAHGAGAVHATGDLGDGLAGP